MFNKKELVDYTEDLYLEASNVSRRYSDGDNELKKNKIISIIREYYKEEKQIDVELLDKISLKSFHEKKDYWLENYGDSKAIVCSLDKKDYWLEPREGTTKNYKFAYAQKISAWSYLIEHNEYHTRNLVFILINECLDISNEPEAKEHLKNNEYKTKKLGTIGDPNKKIYTCAGCGEEFNHGLVAGTFEGKKYCQMCAISNKTHAPRHDPNVENCAGCGAEFKHGWVAWTFGDKKYCQKCALSNKTHAPRHDPNVDLDFNKKFGAKIDYAKLKKDILDPFEIATNSARERLTLKGATDTYYHENDTQTKIARLFNNFRKFLIEKNKRCGDSALKPNQIFCKESGSKQIMSRLDDKLSRIANSEELKKNDLSDVFGYVALLLISNGWLTFDEFLD